MYASHLTRYEANKTENEGNRTILLWECDLLQPIDKDEKLLGFNNQILPYGGYIFSPIISDVQDEILRKELMDRKLKQRDAEHITQAICNDCDVFLTCDVRTIIKPHGQWIEERFKLRVMQPSELLKIITEQGTTVSR
jgi:hypothetical protein